MDNKKILKTDFYIELHEGDFLEFLEYCNKAETTYLLIHLFKYLDEYISSKELRQILLKSILESHKETDFSNFIYKKMGNKFIEIITKEIKTNVIRE